MYPRFVQIETSDRELRQRIALLRLARTRPTHPRVTRRLRIALQRA
jgi:hypothetical protein